ncbi:EAL domain-containing protein [Nocardia asiatica]|uniref:EAL domain-containing protein n=1 Tax=Nocardia asiatica TaxID=209252 RepID=UPI00031B9018|nr:EAL domain-containing protein [Nocardia asiatica]
MIRLPDREMSRAVLIGIDTYDHLPDLSGVHAGAKELRDVLTDPVHGSLLLEGCVLLPEQASPADIGNAIAEASDQARDLLLIYFAGHGVLGPRRSELHLAVTDTHPLRPGIGGVPFDAVRDLYLDSATAARVVILDCCYSGRALGLNQSPGAHDLLVDIAAEGTAVLTSAPPNGISKKLDAETYPAYTDRLIRLLREGMPGGEEFLTLPALHRQLCYELTALGLRQPQADLNPLLDHLGLIRNRAHPAGPPFDTQLRDAIRSGQLILHYQPEIDLRTGEVLGIEALVRWNHPTRGFLSAHTFVSAAEKVGLAGELGWWVIRTACAEFAGWQADGLGRDLMLRINVSPTLLDEPAFVEKVGHILHQTGVECPSVCIEITEREDTDFDTTVATVRGLKRLGVQVGIDSFGTYNSSIKMVQRLPVDSLEVDRAFVQRLNSNTDDVAIVRAIIALATSFGLSVSAAGVETPQAAQTLIDLGCYRAQGFLFAPPMSHEEARALIARKARVWRL